MALDGGSLKWPAAGQPVFATSTTQIHPLGARGEDRFGRVFRYCLVGGQDLVAGNVIQAAAQVANHQDLTPSAAALEATSITATAGATAASADDYRGGMVIIDTTPGEGYAYPIRTHAAWTNGQVSGGVVLQLVEGWTIQVALTAANSKVSIYANPYSRVIQAPATTLTNAGVGIAPYPLDDADFGWLGVYGLFGVLMSASTSAAVGTEVATPSGTAGAAMEASGVKQTIGVIMDTAQNSHIQGVLINI